MNRAETEAGCGGGHGGEMSSAAMDAAGKSGVARQPPGMEAK